MADLAVDAQCREFGVTENDMSDSRYIPVRLSHLLRHSAVGAIVRGPEYLMTVKDIRDWTKPDGSASGRVIPYVEQVKSAMDVTQDLREPPVARVTDKRKDAGALIPAQRFPAWMICPSCHHLYYQPWKDEIGTDLPRCRHDLCTKKSLLEQVPWVLIHLAGHMADLPWHYLTHAEARGPDQKQCRHDASASYLRLTLNPGGSRELSCSRCHASTRFDESARLSFDHLWRQPWLREAPESGDDEPGVVVGINDARVHSSIVRSALVIPPESRIHKGSVVDRLYSNSGKRAQIEQATSDFARKQEIGVVAKKFRCSSAEIEDALAEIQRGYPLYGATITQGLLLESEYRALIEPIPDMIEDEDFVTQHRSDAWQSLKKELPDVTRSRQVPGVIDRVVAVNRLKEIMVMLGFQRMSGSKVVPPDIIGESDWLPALELYGEGIFFTLTESVVRRWESQPACRERANDFDRRYQASGRKFDPDITVDPRFLLLHTVSHLLIRELETEAGYSAASLKERIYCSSNGKLRMAGILVYVAVPDVVGSLGGLGELAEPNRFLRLMTHVFDHAQWCSLDPVCSEHEGQGPDLLNRAACHACALVPEPSCAYGNVLLDRSFLRGSEGEGITAFLDFAESGE